ncbi:MAG: hypothetical protein VB140_03560 [Burkholderia sp.]
MLHKSSVRTKWNGLHTSLVRNPFVSPEIMPVDGIVSSRSIYATTPTPDQNITVESPVLFTEKISQLFIKTPYFRTYQ